MAFPLTSSLQSHDRSWAVASPLLSITTTLAFLLPSLFRRFPNIWSASSYPVLKRPVVHTELLCRSITPLARTLKLRNTFFLTIFHSAWTLSLFKNKKHADSWVNFQNNPFLQSFLDYRVIPHTINHDESGMLRTNVYVPDYLLVVIWLKCHIYWVLVWRRISIGLVFLCLATHCSSGHVA